MHILFRSVLFNLQVFGNLPFVFLLVISSLTPPLRQYTLYYLYYFQFVNSYFIIQKAIYLVKVPHELKKNMYYTFAWQNIL